MDNKEPFTYYLSEDSTHRDLNRWLEWASFCVKEFISFDVLEVYFYESDKHKIQLNYYQGTKELFQPEGITLPIALQVFKTQTPYIFPHSSIQQDPLAQTKVMDNLPRWKFILPIIYDGNAIGILSVCSSSPVSSPNFVNKKLTEICKQSGILFENITKGNRVSSSRVAYKNLFDNINERFYFIDTNYHLLVYNKPFEEFIKTNYSLKELIPGSEIANVLGDEFADFKPYFDKALGGEKLSFNKAYFIGGKEQHVHYSVSPVYEGDMIIGIIIIGGDYAELGKNFSVRVQDSLIQHIPDIIWIVDERGDIKFVNAAFERATGYSIDEVAGRSSFEFFSKEELPNHLQQMLLYLSGSKKQENQFFQFKFYTKQGKALILETTAINLLEHPEIKGIVVSARNITLQASDKQELENKEELYRSLFESLSEAIFISDTSNTLIYCNAQLTKMTGYSFDELTSMPLYQIVVAEEYWPVMQEKLGGRVRGSSEQYEVEIVRKNGTRFWASLIDAPYRNKNGEVVGVVSALTDITERKKTEEEIHWLAKFPEEDPSPILRVSKEGKIIYNNTAANIIIRQIGDSQSRALNNEWNNIVSKHIQAGTVGKIDLDIEGKYFSLTLTQLISNSYINIYATDISDRIAFQKQLLESEQRLQFLMNSTNEGIMVYENGIILDMNIALARMFGYTYEEMLGKSILNFVHEKNREMINESIRQDITLPYEILMYRKDGTTIFVEIQGRSHFYKGRKVKVVALTDITLRRRAELLSKENEERLKYFLGITSEGIILLDGGKIIDSNSAFAKIVGMRPEEVNGQPIESIYDTVLRDKLSSLSALRDSSSSEFKFKRRDGTVLHVELFSQLQEYMGRMIRVALLRDITKLKKDEEDLVMAKRVAEEAQKAEEQFLAKMSHEIRTPMNGVIGLTDILLRSSHDKEQTEYLNLIKESADNLLVIINDILDLSKIRAGKIQFENIDINLREVFKTIYSSTLPKATEKKVAYNYTVDSRIPEFIQGDQVRLNQILLNLLSNALKFTERGRIHFSAELISSDSNGLLIQFKVEDTGIGIHEKDQDKVFETYRQAGADTTRKFGGTGLGLPIVKQLVELQGGTIGIKSSPGQGSTFMVTLSFGVSDKAAKQPVLTEMREQNGKKTAHAVESNGIRILLVDDNFINRLLVNHLLEQKGYEIIEAENGYQAIEKLKEEDIDLVLMDISMPDLDGLEATRIIRKMDPAYIRQTPIIAMTAHAFQDQIQGALDAGMNDYISKPFKSEELYSKIENQLNPPVVFEGDKKKDVMDEKFYDLSFLNQYYDNEEEFILSILALYAKETPGSIAKIEESVNRRDFASIKALTHKIKTNILMMGIKKAEPFIKYVASINTFPPDEEAFMNSFNEFKYAVLNAIKQIEKDKLAKAT